MTEEKRQKVLLAVLAVCVLGAGGVWVALHDWSGSGSGRTVATSAERKVRETVQKERPTRSGRETRKGKVTENRRKARATADREPKQKKTRQKKRGDKRTKKKEIVPVA